MSEEKKDISFLLHQADGDVVNFEANGLSQRRHALLNKTTSVDSNLKPRKEYKAMSENNLNATEFQSMNELAHQRQLLKSKDFYNSTNSVKSKSNIKRFVTKEGFVDIKYVNMPGINSRFLKDIFHTLIDAKWRYLILLFSLSFMISWVLFGTSWYVIVYFRGKETNCVDKVHTWLSAFLFSIETQTTIGYGGRAITTNCPEAIVLLVIQNIIGMFINSAMLGLLFGKLARPKNRGKTTMFSRNAVITVRDGRYCLIFRYADLRHSRLLDSNMRLVMIRARLTQEGEYVPLDMADLKLTIDYHQTEYTLRLFPLFPVTIIHIIDEESPLYNMTKSELGQAEFEIIPILEGTVPTTGNTAQALTSYRPGEILWGHRFRPVFFGMQLKQSVSSIDLSTLHDTYEEHETPDCSAEEFANNVGGDAEVAEEELSISESNGYQSAPSSAYSLDREVTSYTDLDAVYLLPKKELDNCVEMHQ